MIYFDNAATSYNRPPCVKEAVAAAIDAFGNPSRGAYSASLDADRCLFETRMQLAALAGAEGPDCVAFTMNATQALSTAIFGLGLQAGDHLIVSLQEHNSVLRPAYRLRDMEDLEQTLRTIRTQSPDARIAVALSHGSNVTGNVIDLSRVSALCSENQATWILDAAQTMGIIPINMRRLGIDETPWDRHPVLFRPQSADGAAGNRSDHCAARHKAQPSDGRRIRHPDISGDHAAGDAGASGSRHAERTLDRRAGTQPSPSQKESGKHGGRRLSACESSCFPALMPSTGRRGKSASTCMEEGQL